MSDFSYSEYRNGAAHPNPTYDFLTGFAPRKLKDLFRWVEYLYYNSPQIFAALQKFAEYPVTEIKINTDAQAQKKLWDKLLNETLRAKDSAIRTGLDRHLYGNSFISVYKPFTRFLVCGHPDCGQRTGIAHVKYKFQLKSLKFQYTCAACKRGTTGTIKDEKVSDPGKITIIRWDPKLMDIDYNPITGKSKFFWTIPGDIRTKVEKGNRHLIDSMPIEFLRALRERKTFGFADDAIYHMKAPAPAGIDASWGLPPLVSTIKLFFYAAVLRKANEAIALDHIVPFRVLHPAPISGNADPTEKLNLANWQMQLKNNIKQWRRDPLHIMFAPTALGVTMMGGQGRSLLTLGEVKEAEDGIIAAMGIPKEFIYGGLSFTGSSVTLRMLENQLETYTGQQNDQLKWIINQVANITGWQAVDAAYIPFKLIDDTEQKAQLAQLNQIAGGPLSKDTLFTPYDIDLAKEREKQQQEMLDDARAQRETQMKMQKEQETASAQAEQAASSGQGLSYNPQAVIAAADQIIQQLNGMEPGARKSFLAHFSQEDPVLSAVVKDRLDSQAQMLTQQAKENAKNQGGM